MTEVQVAQLVMTFVTFSSLILWTVESNKLNNSSEDSKNVSNSRKVVLLGLFTRRLDIHLNFLLVMHSILFYSLHLSKYNVSTPSTSFTKKMSLAHHWIKLYTFYYSLQLSLRPYDTVDSLLNWKVVPHHRLFIKWPCNALHHFIGWCLPHLSAHCFWNFTFTLRESNNSFLMFMLSHRPVTFAS